MGMITSSIASRLAAANGLTPDTPLHLELIAVEKRIKTVSIQGLNEVVYNAVHVGNPKQKDQVIDITKLTSEQAEFFEILVNSGYAVTRDYRTTARWNISWESVLPEGPVLRGQTGPSGPMTPMITITADYAAVKFQRLMINTLSAPVTVTLPASPAVNDEIHFVDMNNTFTTNNLTIARNGQLIGSVAENLVCDIPGYISLVFIGGSVGWKVLF